MKKSKKKKKKIKLSETQIIIIVAVSLGVLSMLISSFVVSNSLEKSRLENKVSSQVIKTPEEKEKIKYNRKISDNEEILKVMFYNFNQCKKNRLTNDEAKANITSYICKKTDYNFEEYAEKDYVEDMELYFVDPDYLLEKSGKIFETPIHDMEYLITGGKYAFDAEYSFTNSILKTKSISYDENTNIYTLVIDEIKVSKKSDELKNASYLEYDGESIINTYEIKFKDVNGKSIIIF